MRKCVKFLLTFLKQNLEDLVMEDIELVNVKLLNVQFESTCLNVIEFDDGS